MSENTAVSKNNGMSLSMKTTLIVVATSTLLLFIFGWYRYMETSARMKQSLEENLTFTVERLALNLARPLYDYDVEMQNAAVRSEMKSRMVAGVFILDNGKVEHGYVRKPDGSFETVKALLSERDHLVAGQEMYEKNTKVGDLRVFVTTGDLDEGRQRMLIQIFIEIIVLDVMLLLVLTLFIRSLLISPLNRLVMVVKNVSEGIFTEAEDGAFLKSDLNRPDDVGEIIRAVMEMKNHIREVLKETDDLIRAVQDGNLNKRGGTESFQGGWRELVEGVNKVINAFKGPIDIAASSLDMLANGKVPDRIAEEFAGDFNEIIINLNKLISITDEITRIAGEIASGKADMADFRERSDQDHLMKALNMMIKQFKAILNETDVVIRAVREGDLSVRGDENAFEGGWRQLVKGSNLLIDAFAGPVNMTAECVARISQGDIPEKITTEYKGDFRHIRDNLNTLISVTGEVTGLAAEIAGGNLGVRVKKRSERDKMMAALEDMVGYLQDVANVTEGVANKDLQVTVTPRSERDTLNLSLGRMVANLRQIMADIDATVKTVEQQNWLKTGLAELGNSMRGEQSQVVLARDIITYLARYLDAQVGAIYLADENDEFLMIASYAHSKRKGNPNRFKLGDGLVGQAALEKQHILFTDIPDDYIQIRSGTGRTVPRNILVFPFVYEDRTRGVVELGMSRELGEAEMNFLQEASEDIAVAFNTAKTREKMAELLKETQKQAEELREQQKDLQSANEELENQTEALTKSEARLRERQDELKNANEELGERTSALELQRSAIEQKNRDLKSAQKKIRQKADELEAASKYKSEFLANMSHELRTPLNSILVLSQLLSRNETCNLTEKQAQFAKTIHTSGSDLLTLINEILDLSKVEAGRLELHLENVNFVEFMANIEQLFGHVAEEKGLGLITEIAEGLPEFIRTDGQRLQQVIRNLLSNAFKFTSEGEVSVRIFRPGRKTDLSQSRMKPAETVAFAVSDTGIGIPEEKKAAIFEAFQQADGTTSRKYGGTGLGLSISREFSLFLGGEIPG